jgi:hypothetical protein
MSRRLAGPYYVFTESRRKVEDRKKSCQRDASAPREKPPSVLMYWYNVSLYQYRG